MRAALAAVNEAALAREPISQCRFTDGRVFHFVEGGDGSPVVFAHGVMGDLWTWTPQWDAFRALYRTISYSRRFSAPNHNLPVASDHSALTEAADLLDLLAHWRAEPAILVGASYGGYASLAAALARPTSVRALVLAEPPLLYLAERTPAGRHLRAQFDQTVRIPARLAFARGDDRLGLELMLGGIAGLASNSASLADAVEPRMRNVASIRNLTLSSNEFPVLADDELRSIECPVLLLRGEATAAIHRVVYDELSDILVHAECQVVPGAGHGMARDNPTAFNHIVLDFLQRHGATR
ncbi:MAG: alpha/beta hydrolase [Pigmentiphaga sp.]|nr:alpha/beta hydrolase [Pigmentiphaga sp.]